MAGIIRRRSWGSEVVFEPAASRSATRLVDYIALSRGPIAPVRRARMVFHPPLGGTPVL